VIFLVPWRGRTLVGTRHLPFGGAPDACTIDGEEIRQLLAEVNAAFPPARLRTSDILAVHAGVLPEKDGPPGGEVQLEKHAILVDHAREDGVEGLVTAAGVKWTTARRVAADALDVVVAKLGSGLARETAQDVPVAGGEIEDFDRFVEETRAVLPAGVPEESVEPLCRAHGTQARALLDRVREAPELGRPIHDGSPVLAVQVLHAIQAEMALRLEDVVLRRTELWLDAADPLAAIERCAEVAAVPLGWDAQHRAEEVRRAMKSLGRAAPAVHSGRG
jgi:glycerol-3-phosphate dehydrogenase